MEIYMSAKELHKHLSADLDTIPSNSAKMLLPNYPSKEAEFL